MFDCLVFVHRQSLYQNRTHMCNILAIFFIFYIFIYFQSDQSSHISEYLFLEIQK